jgi:hypothetical protein
MFTAFGGISYRLGEGGVIVTNGLVHDTMVDLVGVWS